MWVRLVAASARFPLSIRPNPWLVRWSRGKLVSVSVVHWPWEEALSCITGSVCLVKEAAHWAAFLPKLELGLSDWWTLKDTGASCSAASPEWLVTNRGAGAKDAIAGAAAVEEPDILRRYCWGVLVATT